MKMRNSKRAVFSAFLFGMFAVTACKGSQPNIIFIFSDDWGYGDLSVRGTLEKGQGQIVLKNMTG